MVASATKVYLGLDCLNTMYTVYINGISTVFSTTEHGVTEFCIYKQVYVGVRLTNINVTVVVATDLHSGRKRQSSDLQFQVNEVLAMDSTTASSSSAATATGSVAPPSSGATGLKTSWLHGFTAVLLAGLGLAL